MLQNDFYFVNAVQRGDQTVDCRISFHADHDIFKGHFPQQPVVPGVCMIQIVKELLEEQTGYSLMLQQAPQVKFLQLILPATEPDISLTWQSEENGFMLNAVFKNHGTALFKMSGRFSVVGS